MKMNRLLGVGMLCFGMLAWNAYGIDRDVSLSKQRVFSGDTGRPLLPSAPAAGFGNTCADLAGGADVLISRPEWRPRAAA